MVGKEEQNSGEGKIRPESERRISPDRRRKVRWEGDGYSFQGRGASQGLKVKVSLGCVCLCVCVCVCVCVHALEGGESAV